MLFKCCTRLANGYQLRTNAKHATTMGADLIPSHLEEFHSIENFSFPSAFHVEYLSGSSFVILLFRAFSKNSSVFPSSVIYPDTWKKCFIWYYKILIFSGSIFNFVVAVFCYLKSHHLSRLLSSAIFFYYTFNSCCIILVISKCFIQRVQYTYIYIYKSFLWWVLK